MFYGPLRSRMELFGIILKGTMSNNTAIHINNRVEMKHSYLGAEGAVQGSLLDS